MKRRDFVLTSLAAGTAAPGLTAQPGSISGLAGSAPIPEPHFPSPLYAYVWRNWELATLSRMAAVVGATAEQIRELGQSMGLPARVDPSPGQLRRGYITVIRQNWHLLPERQIVALLGWDEDRFRFTLKEDDFLDVKMARNKPQCQPVRYRPPTKEERSAAARIRQIVKETFGPGFAAQGEPRFEFVKRLSEPLGQRAPSKRVEAGAWNPRFLYSYFALYGDPLMETEIDPFPGPYLERLAESGVTGVWLQAVLNTLAPAKAFPEFGRGWETRLANLKSLVDRADRAGLKVYLYLNEPRAMPAAFFAGRASIRGASYQDVFAMCTSTDQVRDWIRESLSHVVRQVPNVGGFFTISMSENHTNCFSHGGAWGSGAPGAGDCPRCAQRAGWDVLAELFETMRQGIQFENKAIDLIHWDWGWGDALAEKLIPLLQPGSKYQSISEWSMPVHRGGVSASVGEYSISVVGPGPRAKRNWALARKAGIPVMAKVQVNNTWEISAIPYIPALDLVARHCRNLAREGVSGLMLSWTCGGYPSPNLEVVRAFALDAEAEPETVLQAIAGRRYGEKAAPSMRAAWRIFSEAFEEFPYGVAVYILPTQHGPANLLRLHPTGHKPGMILFPHDAYQAWAGKYPPEVVRDQCAKLARRWRDGLPLMERALPGIPPDRRREADLDLAIARTSLAHFQSVANQIGFYLLRDQLPGAAAEQKAGLRRQMRTLVQNEMEIARQQYPVARRHSEIGFEASNHYYYTPLDLAEKVLNCQTILRELAGEPA